MARGYLVLLHGFLDTPATWERVLGALERRFEVLAPPVPRLAGAEAVVDALVARLDEADWELPHVAGSSLGGYLALKLAERGRARSVVAFTAAGGWAPGDESYRDLLAHQATLAPAQTPAAQAMIAAALEGGWPLDAARVTCPVRFVWGGADPLLPWPRAAARYRGWFPRADWVRLDGVGHYPQLEVPAEAAALIPA
jgi:pimeloyl-ACP methyl ester carboxylesterase